MLNKTSGTFSASGAISSAIENAITAMPTQTSRTKNLLPAFADILATSSETASWTGSESTSKPQVAGGPQNASGPGNRMASVGSLSAEPAAQAPGTEQLVLAYALPMNDWAMPSPENPILTMKSAAPSETTITGSSAPSSSVASVEVGGPQTSNRAATTPTNVTPATSTALISSLPMSRRDASSIRVPGNGFLENTLPVAETSSRQPVTSAEFEPSLMGAFVSPSAPPSSAPKVASQGDFGLKAFSGSAQTAALDSNATQSTPMNFAPLLISDLEAPRPALESSFGYAAATLTANPAEIPGPAVSGAQTTTLSSAQTPQNIVEGHALKNLSQHPMPAEVSAGGDETDTLAEALGALLRRFSASSVTSTVISNVPSVVTTTSAPAAADADFLHSDPISVPEPTTQAAPSTRPLASENSAPVSIPVSSVDTPTLDTSATILPPDFATFTISYEQNSERSQPATGTAASSTPSDPNHGPTDFSARPFSVTPILTPIVSQPIPLDPTTTAATPLMTSTVRTSTAPSTVIEASSVLEVMVVQTVDAVLTQAPASAPHAPGYTAERIVAPTMEPTIPMAAAPFIAATATLTSPAPQQKAASQSFAISPTIETPSPASETALPQPTTPSVASPKIPFVLTPTAANPANSAPDNLAPFKEPTMTAPMIPAQPALSNEKPVWGIATNATTSGVPEAADAPPPAAPAAFNQDSESQTDTSSHSPNYSKASSTESESAAIATPAPASAGAAFLAQVVSIAASTPKLDASDVAASGTAPNHNASSDAQLPSSVLAQPASEGQELSAALQAWNGGDNVQTRLVQAAHLGGNLRESEMNISMQAESLGAVELRARVSGDVVGATIGVERHDAHAMISNNLSSLHDALQERQLRLGNVTVFQSPVHSGATAGDGSAPQQRGTAPRQSASAGSTGAQSGLSQTEAAAATESSEGNAVFDSNGRLSVRA
jgi:hypothetical protein